MNHDVSLFVTAVDVINSSSNYNASADVTTVAAVFTSLSDVTKILSLSDVIRNDAVSRGCVVINSSMAVRRDESGDLVSSAVNNMFTAVRGAILIPLLFFVGFPTNILSMAIFYKQGLRHRINLCLFFLALVDLLLILFMFLFYADNMRPGALSTEASYRQGGPMFNLIAGNYLLGLYGLGWASSFISMVIATERCICVVWPLKARSLLKTKFTGAVLVVGVVLITAGRFAVTNKYKLGCVYDVATGVEARMLMDSDYYKLHKKAVDVLDGVMYGGVMPLTFLVIIMTTTAITTVKLHQATRFRLKSGNSGAGNSASVMSQKEAAVTRMLIFLAILILVLYAPNISFRLGLLLVPNLSYAGKFGNFYVLAVGVVEVCALINSSTKFFIYVLTGSKYRETARELLVTCCRWRKVGRVVGRRRRGEGEEQSGWRSTDGATTTVSEMELSTVS